MQIITPFDPSAAVGGTINTGLVNRCAVIYLINESAIGIKLLFADGSTGVVPPWFARAFQLAVPNAPIQWSQLYTLGSTGAPVSIVQGEGYEPNEVEWAQLSQGPLARQVNVGNTVTTTQTSNTADFLQNDGSPATSVIIEATPIGDTTSAVVLKNDGTLILGDSLNHGSLSSDNGTFKTDGSGNLTAHNVTASGNMSVTGNTTVSGTFTVGGSALKKATFFSGSGSGTYNHNFGSTPAWIGIIPTSSTDLLYITTVTSTTVTVGVKTAGTSFIGIAVG